ncbi:MAG: deoxyribodipyrimidine photo-lyase [Candidatus Kapaibacterium sp.]
MLNSKEYTGGAVIYWMSRDQRMYDNRALNYARDKAEEYGTNLAVCFCPEDYFPGASQRQFAFMLKGLVELAANLYEKNVPFALLKGKLAKEIPEFLNRINAGLLITDFDPLKIKRKWNDDILKSIRIPFHEADAHNIVPCRIASDKQEYAAYTIRPKIHRLLPEFLSDFPVFKCFKGNDKAFLEKYHTPVNYDLNKYKSFPGETRFAPGEEAAHKVLRDFIDNRLDNYAAKRNDPAEDHLSGLSPYFHFGQLAPQRAVLEVLSSGRDKDSVDAFIEEAVVRRELSDNFCFYNENYDNTEGFPDWAKKSIAEHKNDKREFIYSVEQFENAETHDKIWNAAQNEMVLSGKMHGYMRMYWAKKILEWTGSHDEAMQTAIYLNDKYELDGRDPNGYTGIAWSIGGVHDRAWPERTVFGKIRYMNAAGLKRKFDISKYIDRAARLK